MPETLILVVVFLLGWASGLGTVGAYLWIANYYQQKNGKWKNPKTAEDKILGKDYGKDRKQIKRNK